MALMSVVDLERESGISRHTWRTWIRQGRIAVLRLGRRVRVSDQDFRQFLAENRKPARPSTR